MASIRRRGTQPDNGERPPPGRIATFDFADVEAEAARIEERRAAEVLALPERERQRQLQLQHQALAASAGRGGAHTVGMATGQRAAPKMISTALPKSAATDEAPADDESRKKQRRYGKFVTGAELLAEQRRRDAAAEAERQRVEAEEAARVAAEEAERERELQAAEEREQARLRQEAEDDAAARAALGLPPAGAARTPLSPTRTAASNLSGLNSPALRGSDRPRSFVSGATGRSSECCTPLAATARGTDVAALPADDTIDADSAVLLSTPVRGTGATALSRHRSALENDALVEAQILAEAPAATDSYERFIRSRTAAAVERAAREARLHRITAKQEVAPDDRAELVKGDAGYVRDAGAVGHYSTDPDVELAVLKGTPSDPLAVDSPMTRERQRNVEQETLEGLQGRWLELVVHARAAAIFDDCITRSREDYVLLATFTPFVKRKLAIWRKQAHSKAYTRARLPHVRLPTPEEARAAAPRTAIPSKAAARLRDRIEVPRCQFFTHWRDRDIAELFTAALAAAAREGRADAALQAPTYRHLRRKIKEQEQSRRARGAALDPDLSGHGRSMSIFSDDVDGASFRSDSVSGEDVSAGPAFNIEASVRSFRKGEYVFFAGDRGTELYVIANGTVDIIAVRDSRSTSCSDGHVGDVVEAVLHKSAGVKRKAKTAANGVVVETLGPHGIFGDAEAVFGGARGVSALCTQDTDVFVISRHTLFTYSSSLPADAVEDVRRAARTRREAQIRKAWPMVVDDIKKEPLFADWNARALNDLAGTFVPLELRRGFEADVRNQSLDLAVYFVVSGVLRVTAERAPGRDSRDDPSFQGDSPAGPAQQQAPTSPAALSRSGLASTLLEGSRVGALAPPALGSRPSSAAPAATASGAGDADEGEVIEVARVQPGQWFGADAVLAGHDVYDRRGHRNVRVEPVEDATVWVLTRLGMSDLAIEHPVGVVESRARVNAAYAASLRQPTFEEVPVLANDALLRYLCPVSAVRAAWAAGATPHLMSPGDFLCKAGEVITKPVIFVVVSGCLHVRSGRDAKRARAEYAVVRDSPHRGFVVGAFEFGMQASTYADSVNCVSSCRVWIFPRKALESQLVERFPLVWSRLVSDTCASALQRRYVDGTLADIGAELYRPSDA